MSKVFGKSAEPAGYKWDGQASTTTLEMKVDSAYIRAVSTLKAMGFVIKEEQSSRQGGKAKIQGAKADQTSVTVWLEDTPEQPGKTDLHVKVGSLGDRTGSERVIDEILTVRKKAPAPKPAADSAQPAAKK